MVERDGERGYCAQNRCIKVFACRNEAGGYVLQHDRCYICYITHVALECVINVDLLVV